MVRILKSREEISKILEEIYFLFPNASCELNYNNVFELLVAVVLSAQTTDKSVNKVTVELFDKYPTPYLLANASYEDVKNIIKSIGLSNVKSNNIIKLSKELVEKFDGDVPNDFNELIKLPGVGRKTANVILSEGFKIPRIAVDTHVERVSKRLEIVSDDASVLEVEEALMSLIDESYWHKSHHLLLFFGRYFCLAKKPNCENCFNKDNCKYYKQ